LRFILRQHISTEKLSKLNSELNATERQNATLKSIQIFSLTSHQLQLITKRLQLIWVSYRLSVDKPLSNPSQNIFGRSQLYACLCWSYGFMWEI
jgi:hypothetical protein